MASASASASEPTWRIENGGRNEVYSTGVSWAAVIAGSFAAAALWLILVALGTGLGFAAVSPWSNAGASASTMGKSAIVWLIVTQLIAASIGGYLAGRLRTRWARIHTDEVYFRDTAHGFLAWAVGLVITAAFLTSAAAAFVRGGAASASMAATASAGSAGMAEGGASGRGAAANAYFVDMLLRTGTAQAQANDAAARAEVATIFANGLRQGELPAEDKSYLAAVVAARTGISEPDAEARVSSVFAQLQQTADAARKAVAHLALWIFLSLLIGAFCASLAATFGGRQRDHVVIV